LAGAQGVAMFKAPALIAIVILLVVMAFVVPKVWQVITAPWSMGQPTLTTTWAGSTQAKLGSEYGLYLDLDYRSLDISGGTRRGRSRGRSNQPNLEGTASLCTPKGERYDYEVSGRADRSGKIEVLYLEYGDPSLSALNFQLRGDWRPDTLTLNSDKNPFLPD
jgi:hypothetical protein